MNKKIQTYRCSGWRGVAVVGLLLMVSALTGCRYARVPILNAEGQDPAVLDAASQIAGLFVLQEEEKAFSVLPSVCQEVYDPELLKSREATTTYVVHYDIDRDGQEELLSWDGNPGSGGGGWSVFVWDGKAWRYAGSMLGSPCGRADGKPGIFFSWACGWDAAIVTYCELEKFSLIQKATFEVEYSEPIRQNPSKITITYLRAAQKVSREIAFLTEEFEVFRKDIEALSKVYDISTLEI